jgi:uncharacterized protein (TIGR02145 family)
METAKTNREGDRKVKIIILLALFSFIACDQQKSTFTDHRDGKEYKIVKIGTQIWMAENLNYAVEDSKCYDNDLANCNKYGRLYNWNDAIEVCPKKWHLPSKKEWQTLVNFVGGNEVTGKMLKAENGWKWEKKCENKPTEYKGPYAKFMREGARFIYDCEGTDEYGFSALPSGLNLGGNNFKLVGDQGYWWSASEFNSNSAWSIFIVYTSSSMLDQYHYKPLLFAVRCLQD